MNTSVIDRSLIITALSQFFFWFLRESNIVALHTPAVPRPSGAQTHAMTKKKSPSLFTLSAGHFSFPLHCTAPHGYATTHLPDLPLATPPRARGRSTEPNKGSHASCNKGSPPGRRRNSA